MVEDKLIIRIVLVVGSNVIGLILISVYKMQLMIISSKTVLKIHKSHMYENINTTFYKNKGGFSVV